MTFTAGTRLGPYEITAFMGAGGMGEVWKARDTRLDRIVAIKTSKDQFSERFDREARTIASLNHPNICQLYDVGPNYLVMELIDGKPLAGPLPLEQALRYAIQICAALDSAHKAGIVHRDLKPANILLTKQGVKLLDFGLAKRQAPAALDAQTLAKGLTGEGSIIGTLQYMAPEQLQSKEADARSDIFSFGLVLYEMLTGQRAFSGNDPASVISAILRDEPPPLSTLAPLTPPSLDRTLRKCLAKEPDHRWQSASDLRDELTWIAESKAFQPPPVSRRSVLPWLAGGAMLSAVGSGLFIRTRRESAPAPRSLRFRISLPEGIWPERIINRQGLAISPSGGQVAMIASGERGRMIWLRRLDSLTASPLEGTEGASLVFWSPDSQFIGFYAGGALKKIPAGGGTPLPICDLPEPWSAAWSQRGVIVAATASNPSSIITLESATITEWAPVRWPRFLPGGNHLLYVSFDPKVRSYRAHVKEFPSGRQTDLMPTDTQAIFVPDQPESGLGYIVFGRATALLAQRFDAKRLTVIGEPVSLAEGIPFFAPSGWSDFDASADGILLHSTGSRKAQITWLNRSGARVGALGDPQDFWGDLRLSPDGRRLAADIYEFSRGGTDTWTYDVAKGIGERATFDPGVESSPVWSPDGTRIAFGSAQAGGRPQLRVKSLSDRGSGEVFPPGSFQLPIDWSSDGRWILYQTTGGDSNSELWLASPADHKVYPLVRSTFDTSAPRLSPDGNHLAYAANDSGRAEIYVQRFRAGDPPSLTGDRRRISLNGGIFPVWRRDGRELFFLAPGRQLMAAAVKPGTDPQFSLPAPLFRLPASSFNMTPLGLQYEASADGSRFLVLTQLQAGGALDVVVAWQAKLLPR